MSALTWQVVARTNPDHVTAAFALEHLARDYARWRNAGRRTWKVVEKVEP